MKNKNKIRVLFSSIVVMAAVILLPFLLNKHTTEIKPTKQYHEEFISLDVIPNSSIGCSVIQIFSIVDEGGGMPCENPEQFKRWYKEYEQTASEQVERKSTERTKDADSEDKKRKTSQKEQKTDSQVVESVGTEMAFGEQGVIDEPQTGEDELEGVVLESEADEVVPTEESGLGDQQETEAPSQSEVVETVAQDTENGGNQVEGGAVCNGTPIYLCHGQMLSEELQEYAYSVCEQFGIGFYYPHLICQMYQESGFRQSAVSPYGDYGLMQLKGIYHDYFKQLAGIPWADLINDPYANIYCGVALIAHYWNQCHDLNTTISAYNTGSISAYNPSYVSQVRQWEGSLQKVR